VVINAIFLGLDLIASLPLTCTLLIHKSVTLKLHSLERSKASGKPRLLILFTCYNPKIKLKGLKKNSCPMERLRLCISR
jgi:hypothetical protein